MYILAVDLILLSSELWQQWNDLFSVHNTVKTCISWINIMELNKSSLSIDLLSLVDFKWPA